MTYSGPLLRATYEVILLHPSDVWLQPKLDPWQKSNPGP